MDKKSIKPEELQKSIRKYTREAGILETESRFYLKQLGEALIRDNDREAARLFGEISYTAREYHKKIVSISIARRKLAELEVGYTIESNPQALILESLEAYREEAERELLQAAEAYARGKEKGNETRLYNRVMRKAEAYGNEALKHEKAFHSIKK